MWSFIHSVWKHMKRQKTLTVKPAEPGPEQRPGVGLKSLTCSSISESRQIQFVSESFWINRERRVTSKRLVPIEVLHVDQQLVTFQVGQFEKVLKT